MNESPRRKFVAIAANADKSGHVCAFYDSTLLFPTNALVGSAHKTGVFVLDMTDPAHPVQTAELVTPAMQSPHESLSLNVPRGLLAADLGNPFTYPGVVDISGAFSPDGNTFWVSAAGGGTLTAIDVSNPAAPVPLWIKAGIYVHGLNVAKNGNSLYYAALGYNGETPGLTILDVIYFNAPVHPAVGGSAGSGYVMSAPAFDPQRGQIWYSDGNEGSYAVRVTNGAWPFPPTFGGP